VQAKSNTVVDLVIVPQCYGTLTGTVFYGDSRLAATNAVVSFGYLSTHSDTNGNYIFTNIVLNENGTLSNAFVTASAIGYNPASTNVTFTNCGATVIAQAIYMPPIPKDNYGSVSGFIYDVQTGLPIAQALVYAGEVETRTDTNGAYLCTNIYIGTGSTTKASIGLNVTAAGYYQSVTNITAYAGQTIMQDLSLLLIGYGGVMGTVRDSVTSLPLTNIVLSVGTGYESGNIRTDTNGHYFSGPLQLTYPNVPTYAGITISPQAGYYGINTNTTITLNTTNVVDLYILKVCTGATILGNVVNAQTQQPITNAYLTDGDPYPAFTDANGNFILTNVTVGNDNSPIQVTVQVSAPGFFSQSKTVTIFCDATIIADFGAPQTASAVIQGVVTNAVTGLPLPGTFIGSQFGESTTTDSNGFYKLTQAPLGANNSSRTWTVTAIPTNFSAQTLSVTVSSNAVAVLNFGFGQPPTALDVVAAGAPDPVTVGSNLVYTITLTNSVTDAANVLLADTLPPGVTFVSAALSANPGGAFSEPVLTNGLVTCLATNLGSNSMTALLITVIPKVAGILTNDVAVTSETPDLNPTGTNRNATVLTTVVAPPAPPTELIVAVQATPAGVIGVGSNLVYSVTLTNTTATATNVQLVDTLPPAVDFIGASVSNAPGADFSPPVVANGAVTISAASFSSNSAVVLLVTVSPTSAGTLTNVANVTTANTNLAPGTVLNASVLTTVTAPAPPTELIVTLAASPSGSVVVGGNLLYTLTLTNTIANATDVQLVDTLPPSVNFVSASVSNMPGADFSPPVFSNGAVTISAPSFRSNSSVLLLVTVVPTAGGNLTNVVNVTSATTNLAPGSVLSASVLGAATAQADLALILAENTNTVFRGSNISYTLLVTNLGPAGAPDVQLDDTFPTGAVYVNSTTSQGTASPASGKVHWDFGALASHGAVTGTLLVAPSSLGAITNSATVTLVANGAAVVDPNLANNTASVTATVIAPVTNTPPPTNLTAQIGAIAFNPQTGLYQQTLLVSNLTGVALTAVRVTILNLPAFVVVYNASGTTNGQPYVESDLPVAIGGSVNFLLQYYVAARQTFTSTNFLVTAVAAATPTAVTGTILQLDRAAFLSEGQLTIEFASAPGHTYVVQYSSDMTTWLTAAPPIVAKSTRTQWIDAGPPSTESPPGGLSQRYYRVVQIN
jgi:uncharacterized repeat protein (TIGR01451 family)